MVSERQWRQTFHGNLIRFLTAEQRLSAQLNRTSDRFPPDVFVWASVDSTLETLGGLSRGGREFFRAPAIEILPFSRWVAGGQPIISECELVASLVAIIIWSRKGGRSIPLRTDNQNVLNWVGHSKSHPRCLTVFYGLSTSFSSIIKWIYYPHMCAANAIYSTTVWRDGHRERSGDGHRQKT